MSILQQIKIRTCSCGRLLTSNDDFKYEVVEEKDDNAIVTLKFVCKGYQKSKSAKCKFSLKMRRLVTGYKDEMVYKANKTKPPGEYEIRAETREVASSYH